MNQKLTLSRFILILVVAAIGYYVKQHPQQKPAQLPANASQTTAANSDIADSTNHESESSFEPAAKPIGSSSQNTPLTANSAASIIVNGPNGNENIAASVQRIRAGKRLDQFRDDGIVFENRESRLPQKPSGYYHEYVHPTAGEHGPGAQRIVTGADGEIYYTPDHYRTFQRVQIGSIND